MLSYSLYHLFANTQAGARFADKTRQAIAFAQLRTQRTHMIVYAGGSFEIFETLSFMQLILHLSPPVQEQLRMWLADHLTQVLGFAIGGPAFAHAFSMHLRLLGRGEYHMPPEDLARRQHPVTWLRVRLLTHRARQMGHHTDADALEHAWDTIAEAMGIVEDYYGFYAPELLPAVQPTLDDMLTETSPRRFTDQEVADSTGFCG